MVKSDHFHDISCDRTYIVRMKPFKDKNIMKQLSTSIYTFSDLIENDCLYVDKTEFIFKLIRVAKGQFFLARPRRFGKSLTLSTLKAVFQGRRELFEGLYISATDYDWPVHPVIHLNLGSADALNADELEVKLLEEVNSQIDLHGVELSATSASSRFQELVRVLSRERGKVVILIDEYDKPILNNAHNKPALPQILRKLKSFYSVVKTTEEHQRFAMLTGVSKFSQVSVFSDLNNLTDITMSADYACMLGYTQEELESNFADYINKLVEKTGTEKEELLRKIREWYNGYRFEEDSSTVYNPVSAMKFFDSGKFKNYWFETGTPRMLIELLKEGFLNISSLENLVLDSLGFSAYDVENLRPEPLLFQTGYLTIRDYDPESGLYTLGYPNREVHDSFIRYLTGDFTGVAKEHAVPEAYRMVTELRNGDIEAFMERLKPFFAELEYDLHIPQEKYYQTVFYLIIRLIGIYVRTEIKTNIGRIDAVIETTDRIYIFEFKLDKTAEEALAQINTRRYYEKYLNKFKEIVLIGANFNTKLRNVDEWLTEIRN